MTQAKSNLHTIAEDFIIEHQDEHLSHDQYRVVTRCIFYLMEMAKITTDTAQDIVLQVTGDRERRHRYQSIDTSLAR